MRLLIMGPPGAGKGTQAAIIGEHYQIPAISTGNIFRVAITNRTPLGERIKRIGMEARVELEKLADAKVFLELWVKVRSGWADDEARVKSFGYE